MATLQLGLAQQSLTHDDGAGIFLIRRVSPASGPPIKVVDS